MWDWLGLGRLFCHKYFFVIPKCVFVTILLKIWVKIVNTNGTQMLIFIQSLKLSKNIYLTNIVIFEKGVDQVCGRKWIRDMERQQICAGNRAIILANIHLVVLSVLRGINKTNVCMCKLP